MHRLLQAFPRTLPCFAAIAAFAALSSVGWLATRAHATVWPQPSSSKIATKFAPEDPLAAVSRSAEKSWAQRHNKIKAKAEEGRADVILLGDSITQGWEFVDVWSKEFPGYEALNAGIASDRVEHILWRVRDGALDGAEKAKVVIILGGINNLAVAKPEKIAATMAALIGEVEARVPHAKIILTALFPTGSAPDNARRAKVKAVNVLYAQLAVGRVQFADYGANFLEKDGSIQKTTMFDFLHLTKKGYRIWAAALKPDLKTVLPRPGPNNAKKPANVPRRRISG